MKVKFMIEYRTKFGEDLAIVLQDKKYPLSWGNGDIWSATIDTTAAALKDYTYVLMWDGLIVRTEWTHHSASAKNGAVIRDKWLECPVPGCPFPRKHQADIFDRPGFRGAGTAVPIFSLRGKDDFGIGEFRDLRPLVDFVSESGQCIIQLLPVNDTTRCGEWQDSYPYSPVSTFALNPMYIHLQDIGVEETAEFKKLQAELNSLREIDYPRVFKEKMTFVRNAFEANGQKELASAACRKFIKENEYWLKEYSEFCARRDSLDPGFYCWTQWHLERQFSEEVKYAHSRGVFLKGDLPIGVSADSAEAYWHPELFNLDSSTGAPPDYFSSDGQNWGFPTYNWEAMAKDDYAWWKARLRKMSQFFDAFRIDHILGFFRIWEIPTAFSSGMMGHFNPAMPYSIEEINGLQLPLEGLFHEDPRHPGMYQPLITPKSQDLPQWQQERFGALYTDFFFHRHDGFWRYNAERKLPELLSATGMLACGEDLGMVPDCVPGVMEHEKILSLKMRGMEGEGEWKYLSVCATSSHDCATLRMQCDHDPSSREVSDMLRVFLCSPSMLAIFPIQDWIALDEDFRRPDREEERINEPADPHHHWRFRLHFNMEELPGRAELRETIIGLLKEGRR
ncbi:MAG: 4-alpha-glucanotransferase [Bacteroidales bacterium]|nr:4-alpha-glucanotransferase [Bacteroidales bacterium]